jgi:hypothetical protein
VFENRVLRRIFGPTRDEVMGEWWKLHSGELHNLYSFPNIRHIKSSRMSWMAHVACVGEERKVYQVLVGKPIKDHAPTSAWEDRGISGRMGSKWTLSRLAGRVWSGFTWLRIETGGGLLWTRWWTFGFWRHWVS